MPVLNISRYNTSRRIHDIKTYPILSPQGATILIYGHENGVSIVWRGGRRFKPQKPQPAPKDNKQNGGGDNAIMIIDSDEEEPPLKAKAGSTVYVDKPEFEEAASVEPYPEIIQTLDLSLGTAALHIAVLPLAPSAAADASSIGASDILKEKMVFAVSSATNDAYLFTLPLTPPSPASKARPELRNNILSGRPGSGDWGESMVPLAGQAKHSRGLAITLVKSKTSSTTERLRDQTGGTRARAVVAAHTLEASGTLRLWDVPLDSVPGTAAKSIEPFQVEYLPAAPSSISFNPTHTTQLLVVCPAQAARIYDFATPSISPDELSTGPFPSQGSWLLSLYAPFAKISSIRKPIVDAGWISHGRAILVLLADGMWGIWDIDGARPSGQTVLGKSVSGIVGAAITAFSCSGYVEGTTSLRAGATDKPRASGEFVPMTPHTRKETQVALSWSSYPPGRLAATQGSISVLSHSSVGLGSQDESVVLWVGSAEHVCVIPGITAFWTSQLRRGEGGGVNLFSGAQPTRMIKLYDLGTGLVGERCCGVGVIPDGNKAASSTKDGGLGVEILIRGETRFVILREAEEGPGMKIGGVVGKRRFADRGSEANTTTAIIVHPRPDATGNGDITTSFNLNTGKYGSVRASRHSQRLMDQSEDGHDMDVDAISLPSRPRIGFNFADTLEAAADDLEDAAERDVELEMLDVLEIDRTLDDMEDSRDSGRKRVFFEDR